MVEEYAALHYTGHPFIDVGVATITAFVRERRPEQVTVKMLEEVVQYIERNYVQPPLRGYLTMAFTSNAWFIQNAYNPEQSGLSEEQRGQRIVERNEWASRHLRQWQQPLDEALGDASCVFFPDQHAVSVSLSKKLLPGRAGRAQIPLVQGDTAVNFFAYGQSGVPISGLALLALQMLPLGCARCGVGFLAVVSDNEQLTFRFAREFLQSNLADIAQAQVAHETTLPKSPRLLKTLLIDMLVTVEHQRSNADYDQEPASITAYNFNNGKEPDLVLYFLPYEIISFLRLVETPLYRNTWSQIVQRAWQLSREKVQTEGMVVKKPARRGKSQGKPVGQEKRFNTLYEDLFDLGHFEGIRRFIRTYFLRVPRRSGASDDPRRFYQLLHELDLVHWSLVELFLEKVVHMDRTRLEDIRQLGDGLAVYIRRQGGRGKRFFRSFFTEQNPACFRALLIKANTAHIKDGQPALFDVDMYIEVFEEGFEIMRPDWRLARDLVMMRMIDQLKDWLAQHPDALPLEQEEDNSDEEQQSES